MRNPDIHVRVKPELLKKLQRDARTNNQTIPQLIRNVLTNKYRSKQHRQQKLAYGFAGPARRKIKVYEDWFAGPAKRKIKTYEDWFSGPPGSAKWKKRKVS